MGDHFDRGNFNCSFRVIIFNNAYKNDRHLIKLQNIKFQPILLKFIFFIWLIRDSFISTSGF